MCGNGTLLTGAARAAVTEFRPLLEAVWKVGQWKSCAAERATHRSGVGVHLASVVQQKPGWGGRWWNWGEVHRTQLRKPRGGITHSSVPSPRLVPSPPICSVLSCVPSLAWLGRCVLLGLQPGACGSSRVGCWTCRPTGVQMGFLRPGSGNSQGAISVDRPTP